MSQSKRAQIVARPRTDRNDRLRKLVLLPLMVFVLAFAAAQTFAENHVKIIKSHGYNFFGELAYPVDYPYLNYVNPDAPKGGEISLWAQGTFDSFNVYSRKGRGGFLAQIPYESLLAGVSDEYGSSYGLLAESLEYPETKEWVIFNLRPEAKFSDGSQVTAEDVVFSHNLFLEQGLPSYSEAVSKRIIGAEVLNPLQVKYTFADDIPRRGLIGQAGGTPVFSKAWYERTGARLDEANLEPAIGSGPYLLDSYEINQNIIYKRNPDYWGKNLPIMKGTANYDSIRIEYFADSNAAFEGFKSGVFTFRQENSSKSWATGYDFPALNNGHVVKSTLPNGNTPRASGFVFNLDREKFQDRRVREAISLAYNFTWTNESLQFGLFKQRSSFWEASDHAATGVPEGAELELLKALGDKIDPAILTTAVREPHTSTARQLDRKNVRRASDLLDEAGWVIDDAGLRRNAAGDTLKVEFLESSPAFDRIVIPFVENMKKLGIDAVYNRVDPAQFTNLSRDREYDMVFDSYSMPLLPSTGLSQQFGSETADTSVFNPSGYSSEAIDSLIDTVVAATNTEDVKVAARAIDRILRNELFIVPVWYLDQYWVAHFDMYEHPEELPPYALGNLDFWWINQDKQAALKEAGALK